MENQSLPIPNVIPNDWNRLGTTIRKIKLHLGSAGSPTFTGLTLSGLTASRLVASDASKGLVSSDLAGWVTGTANEITVTDDGDGTITISEVPYAQVVTVAKSGGDFTTIQGAIDSITDATTSKRYVVRVFSGVYTESVTCKDYVDILGAGRTNTIISGTSGTVLTLPANKCTVSELGISVDYGTLGATSTAITSAGADSVLKDCDITVTKSGGGYVMNGLKITAGSFRMSDCYFAYSITGATGAPQLTQSAIVQSGTLTTVIMNNNEITATCNDTDDDLVGFETTATITGKCLLANNVIDVDGGAACSSVTGLWLYGTGDSAIFNQNRITVNCNASAYGLWVDSTAGGAVVDTRHNEIIVTAVGAAEGGNIATGDTWNSTFDKITAKTAYTGAGTITFVSSEADGNFTVTGDVTTSGRITNVTRITGATTLDATYHHVFGDTDGGAFTVTLPAGAAGREYRIVNTGSSGNNLTIAPNGAELLLGVNSNFTLFDGESLLVVYEATEGWF